jgi:hypothetical protein
VAIWLAQIGFEFRFIAFIQGSQQSLQYYLRELQSKPYVYGTDHLPWDGGTPSLQTGRSIRDQMIAAGRRVKVMPQLKVEQGIQALGPSSGSASSTPRSASTASRPSGITATRWMRSWAACANASTIEAVTALVSPQAANIERVGFAVLGVAIKAIDDAGTAGGAGGLNLSLDAQLVADIKSIVEAVKSAVHVTA